MKQITRLLIARHGNTFGPKDIIRRVGSTDLSLVESGFEQGQRLGQYLLQKKLIPDVVFTSELQRTQQTAKEVCKSIAIEIPTKSTALFNEIDYGPDENKTEQEVLARIGQQALTDWDQSAIVPEGWCFDPKQAIANWHQFAKEIEAAYPGKTILVVTSNGIARFAPYLTGDFAHFSQHHKIKVATGAVCIFEKSQDAVKWDCKEWNSKP